MKTITSLSSALLLSVLFTSPAHSEEWSGHVSGYLGNKQIEQDAWANNDEHGAIGIITDFKQADWPVSIAIDLFATGNEESVDGKDFDTYSAQAHLGVRKIFDFEDCRIHPYIGGGAVLAQVIEKDHALSNDKEESDSDIGTWVGSGAYIHVTDNLTLGLDVRYSKTDVTLQNKSVDFSGVMTGLTVGYRW